MRTTRSLPSRLLLPICRSTCSGVWTSASIRGLLLSCTPLCTAGGLEDSAKIAKYLDEWYLSPPHRVAELVRKASTHRYLSFDPVTEHIPSEMRLVLRSDKGKAGVLYRACLDLPSAACPTFHGVRQVYARMQGGLRC